MHQIHDRGYKRLFKNKEIFRQLLETFVDEPWVAEVDFGHCETLDKSFVSDHYKETTADVIYKASLKEQEIIVVILLEFKSEVDYFTSLNLSNYITNFYMDYVTSHRNPRKLPPVFPLLLYNGSSAWTVPTDLSEVIDGSRLLGSYGINFRYFKIAINELSKEKLLKIKNVVSTLFLIEAHYDIALVIREFLAVFQKQEDKTAISLLLNWFVQLYHHGRIPVEDYDKLERTYSSLQEVRNMLTSSIQKEKEEIFEKGRREGKLEDKLETAQKMIAMGFEIGLILELTGLSQEEILPLLQETERP
ncbi:MAG: Rpn family recombination-promoting nuclease/putative transposase [bacterium]